MLAYKPNQERCSCVQNGGKNTYLYAQMCVPHSYFQWISNKWPYLKQTLDYYYFHVHMMELEVT